MEIRKFANTLHSVDYKLPETVYFLLVLQVIGIHDHGTGIVRPTQFP